MSERTTQRAVTLWRNFGFDARVEGDSHETVVVTWGEIEVYSGDAVGAIERFWLERGVVSRAAD